MASNSITNDHHLWTRDTVKNVSGDVTLDIAGDLTLDVGGDTIKLLGAAGTGFYFTQSSSDWSILNCTNDKDIIFNALDNAVVTEVMRLDGSESSLLIASGKKIEYGHADEHISGDGSNLTAASGGNVVLDATGDVVLEADGDQVSMKFGGATGQIDFSNENSGDGIIRQMVDAKDLVIQQFDGDEVARFTDGGDLKITNTVYFAAETANTIADGATGAIDWNVSQKQNLTITGTGITVNFTDPAGACNLLLRVTQGDGSDVIGTWDGDIKWAGGSAPTLSTGNGEIDILSFYYDGSKYYGVASLDFS